MNQGTRILALLLAAAVASSPAASALTLVSPTALTTAEVAQPLPSAFNGPVTAQATPDEALPEETPADETTPAPGTTGETTDETGDPAGDSAALTHLQTPADPYWKEILLLEAGKTLDPAKLPQTLVCLDERGGAHTLPVTWSTEVPEEPGLHTVTGALEIPEDATVAEDFSAAVTWPVFRQGEGASLMALPETPVLTDPILGLKGDPAKELTFAQTQPRLLVGLDFYLPLDGLTWTWDWSTVKTAAPGRYTVTGTLTGLPAWVTLPEGQATAELPVYVLPTDALSLLAPVALDKTPQGDPFLTLSWLYDSKGVKAVTLERQTGENTWEACPQDWYRWTDFNPTRLDLFLTKLPKDTQLTLRLAYQDAATGKTLERVTEPLTWKTPADWTEALLETTPDQLLYPPVKEEEPVTPPVQEEPPVVTPPQPEIPRDVITDTSTTLSGRSLNLLASHGESVSFEHQGVTLIVPSKVLTDLKLAESDLFTLTITQPKKGSVQVVVNAGGKAVTDLKGSTLKVPYDLASNKTISCKDANGKTISKVTYDTKADLATIPVDQAGTYTLSSTAKATTTTKKNNTTKKTTTKKSSTKKTSTKKVTASKIDDEDRLDEEEFLEEDTLFLEEGFDETFPEDEFETFDEDIAEEDVPAEKAPRTLWDEQTPTALALGAVSAMLVAAGILLRKWRGE